MEGLTSRVAPALDDEIELAAGVSGRVMVTAESQAMRRFVAQQIHQRCRARNPFVTTTCSRLLDDPEVLRKAAAGTIYCDIQESTLSEQQVLLAFVGALRGGRQAHPGSAGRFAGPGAGQAIPGRPLLPAQSDSRRREPIADGRSLW